MVTIQEARQKLQQRQQEVSRVQEQIEQTSLPRLSRVELQERTRQDIVGRKLQERELQGRKEEAMESLRPFEQQLKEAEVIIIKAEKEEVARKVETTKRGRFRDILDRIARGRPIPPNTTPKEVARAEKILEPFRQRSVASIKLEVLSKQGLIPVFDGNKLTGFRDTERGVSISPESIGTIGEKRLKALEKAGILEFEKVIKEVKDEIKQRPTQISLPSELPKVKVEEISGLTRLKTDFEKLKRVLNVPEVKPIKGLKRLTGDITKTLTISEDLTKETKVEFIELPSIPKGTRVTRPVDFRDINTGVLPPKQNLELISAKILFDFNKGKLSEKDTLKQLETAQKKFIKDESVRTAGLRFVEGVGIGALTVLAPPLGVTAIALSGTDALFKRREIIEFAKTNPKAAAIQFSAGVAGGFVGAGGVSALKLKTARVETPTVEIIGTARTKFRDRVINNLDEDIRVEFEPSIRNTATRVFKIDIPSPKNKVTLTIIEFTKNNQKRFVGMEFINGKLKPNQVIRGRSITKGIEGRLEIITRSIKQNTKRGLTNLEISEFLERATLKSQRKKGLRAETLTENEAKLSKQFGFRGLKPDQVREILRRPLFGLKEAQKRANKPFTENEFKLAKKLSKSQVLLSERIVRVKGTRLSEQLSPLIGERNILDVRVIETGEGVSYVFRLPKVKTVRGKAGAKVDVRDFTSIQIKKVKPTRKTPISKTFSEQSQQIAQILKSKKTPSQKTAQLATLERKVSPTGAFKAIAKRIQQERIKLAKKQAVGEAVIIASGAALKTKPKLVQKIKKLSKSKTKTSLALVDIALVVEAQKLALAGKITTKQLQGLKTRLATKLGVPLKTITKRITTKKPPPRIPIVPLLPKEERIIDEKLIKAVKKLGKKGVDVIVGLKFGKRKIIAKNLPPWKALMKGQKFVDTNIQASFRLKDTGKKARGKDIKPFPQSIKFRSSKTNPLFRVEKRKFRLDHPREVSQLKSFKGKVPSNFFPRKRKRRKKK